MTKQNRTQAKAEKNRYNGARRAARGALAVVFVALAAAVGGAEKATSPAPISGAQLPAQITHPAAHSVIPAKSGVRPSPPVIPAKAGIQPSAYSVIPAQAGIHSRDSGAFFTPRRKAGGVKAQKRFRGGGIRQKTPPATLPSANSHPPLALQAGGKKPVIPAAPLVIPAAPLVIPAQAGIQTRPAGRAANIADIGKHADILNGRFRWNEAIADIGGGLSFADYYKREQVRLLSALDNALSQKAESVLTENFAIVKRADIDLQSELGGRKAHFAAHLIGKIAEADNRAFGWQLRAYAASDNTPGANAGFFFRTAGENILLGANAFVDYESGEYGKFLRYSIGGELMHKHFALAANYYLPITGERVNATVAAFSREGYDANLKVNLPYLDALKARAEYYHFDGKGGTKAEDGFRFGMEYHPSASCRIGVLYDENSEKFGGDAACSYSINSPSFPQRRESKTDFTPDLFAPASREYSQRIASRRVAIVTRQTITTTRSVFSVVTLESIVTFAVASVQVTTSFREAVVEEVTTGFRFLLPVPLNPATRPVVITLTRNLHLDVIGGGVPPASANVAVIVTDNGGGFPGDRIPFPNEERIYHLTVVEGSEVFVAGIPNVTATLLREIGHLMTVTLDTDEILTVIGPSVHNETIITTLTTFAAASVTFGAAAVANAAPNGGAMSKTPRPKPPQMASAFSALFVIPARARIHNT